MMEQTENLRRELVGTVLSNKMLKTVVVSVERHALHPFYKKVLKKVTRLKAHDETRQCRVGDRVLIRESRPLSKEKHWKVAKVLESAAFQEEQRPQT
jgi:small subunit ribosomal protein S17